jgi:uncharacterized protein (TIGR04255 family)
MKNTALGQWEKAPLAYVLTQIRFEAITEMESKYLKEFQEAIREKYPRFSRVQRFRFSLNADKAESDLDAGAQVWDSQNPDRTKCVRVEPVGLTYMVTSYTTFEQFSEEFEWIISEFYKVTKKLFVTRLGERYIDFILPSNNNHPEKYVEKPLSDRLQVEVDGLTAQFNYYEYRMDEGKLIVKYTRAQGRPELPPDLGPISIEPSEIMKADYQGESALLDTDRIIEVDRFMDCDEVIASFRKMHQDLSVAFKKITTEFARKEWGEN